MKILGVPVSVPSFVNDMLHLNAAEEWQRGSDHAHYDWMTPDGDYVPIDYDLAYANGSRFVFLKVCNGAIVQDHAVDELVRAKASPLFAAPYHWCYPVSVVPAERQAAVWFSVMKDFKGAMAIDFEETYPTNPISKDLKAVILAYWKLDPNRRIVIYTRKGYWDVYGDNDPFWKQFVIWLSRPGSYEPLVPSPWTAWDIWQDSWSADPKLYGVTNGKKAVDTNRFRGSLTDLALLIGEEDGGIEPPEPPIEGETMEITPKYSDGSKIRSEAVVDGTDANRVGKLLFGQKMTVNALSGTARSEQWAEVMFNGQKAYIAVWYQNSQYAVLSGTLPPVGEPTRTHVIEVFSDGKISVDGGPQQ